MVEIIDTTHPFDGFWNENSERLSRKQRRATIAEIRRNERKSKKGNSHELIQKESSNPPESSSTKEGN